METLYEVKPCHLCGVGCSTHPDAGNSMAYCGDCGGVTCPDHRVDDMAERCNACAAKFYLTCDACGDVATALSVYPPTGSNLCAACLKSSADHDAAHSDDALDRCAFCGAEFLSWQRPDHDATCDARRSAVHAHIDNALTVPAARSAYYWLVRLAGRCADGFQRGGGSLVHVVATDSVLSAPTFGVALCGAKPGRRSAGFVEVHASERWSSAPTCPRCIRKAAR